MNVHQLSTFTEDCLSLKPFAERLERFLDVERQFVDSGLVVSLGAPFGSGKTTFLRMWKADLDDRRKSDASLPRPIILNAWESDFAGDPLVAIVSGLIEAIETGLNELSPAKTKVLREAAKDAAWFATGVANSVISHLTGIDAIEAGEFAAKKTTDRKPKTPDLIRLHHLIVAKEKPDGDMS